MYLSYIFPLYFECHYRFSGLDVYAYVTPFVIAFGILGNLVSLRVFMSRRMRKMSASLYLACLGVSDTAVLLTYVLIEWLHRGLPRWTGHATINLPAWSDGKSSS